MRVQGMFKRRAHVSYNQISVHVGVDQRRFAIVDVDATTLT